MHDRYAARSASDGDRDVASRKRAAHGPQGDDALLVEDEPTVRQIIKRILTQNGDMVLEASDGREMSS